MKERPIVLSASEVRRILAGRKTQLRRPLNPHPPIAANVGDVEEHPQYPNEWFYWLNGKDRSETFHCPFGASGDRLWAREKWTAFAAPDDVKAAVVAYGASCHDDAFTYVGKDGSVQKIRVNKWTPASRMPREASRITLEIESVRVERVSDISEEDAEAEGGFALGDAACSFRAWFRGNWDARHGKNAPWASNPWAWVVGFKRVEAA